MARVFVSYSHVDSAVADDVTDVLKSLNISYFRDVKNIEWGSRIEAEVREELLNCSCILVVVSPASLKSAWVPYEIGHASAMRKTILPFLTHPSLDLPLYLNSVRNIASIEQLSAYFEGLRQWTSVPDAASSLKSALDIEITPADAATIDGRWIGNGYQQFGPDKRAVEFEIQLTINLLDELSASELLIRATIANKLIEDVFTLRATLVNGRFLWVNYYSKKDHSFGSGVFDLTTDDTELIGHFVGYGARTKGIVSGFSRLRRSDPD